MPQLPPSNAAASDDDLAFIRLFIIDAIIGYACRCTPATPISGALHNIHAATPYHYPTTVTYSSDQIFSAYFIDGLTKRRLMPARFTLSRAARSII